MKHTTLTIIALLLAVMAFGQSNPSKLTYWRIVSYFTLDNGCESASTGYPSTTNGYSINFNDSKKLIAAWVKPLKIKSYRIGSMEQITKAEWLKGVKLSEKFHCPEPVNYISFSVDTTHQERLDITLSKWRNDTTLIIKNPYKTTK